MAAAVVTDETFLTTRKSGPELIKADLLIPGRGEPVIDGALVWENGIIKFAGTIASLPNDYQSLHATVHVPILMPGLWDCHAHFFGAMKQSFVEFTTVPQSLAGARGAHDVAQVLNAGYTSVRELAGYGTELNQAISEGLLVGPRIYSAVCALSQTGGHADSHSMPVHMYNDYICHGLPFQLCDGVDACIRAVRLQLRKGAKVIKICASGGVTSELDDPHHQQFSDAEMKAIVDEATRANRIVAAHCHGKPGIMAALRAGCKTIEHGTYLDDESIEMMKDKGAILVATRTIMEAGLKSASVWDSASYAKLVEVGAVHKTAYKKAVAAGVKLALGSDIGLSKRGTGFSHGDNGSELQFAVDAGLTPLQAIEAATANAPETLGLQAPLSGQLKEGYDADFIALISSPLEDIKLLADARSVTHVWKGGKLYKSPDIALLPGAR